MIEVGAMAGTGKTTVPGTVSTPVGARAEAADQGAFGESLKASVAAVGKHVPLVPPSAAAMIPARAVVVPAPTAVAIAVPAAGSGSVDVGSAKASAVSGSVSAVPENGAEPSAGKGLEAEVHAPVQPEVAKDRIAITVVVAGDGGGSKRLEGKSAKTDEVGGEKKAVAKDGEAGASAPVVQDGMAGVANVTMPVTVAVPVTGSATVAVTSTKEGKSAELSGGAVTGTGKAGKVAGPNGGVKPVMRGAKKMDGSVAADAKPGVADVAGVHRAGSGAGPGGGKDATAAAVMQGGVGAGAAAPVGAMGSHAGVAGVAGVRVAASVDGVAQGGGQANVQGNISGEVKTLAATPNLLEVGIESGTHGWLRVRAEMGQTGEVTASMVAASAGQADTLRRELPAMSTYLAGESVGVSSLVVNAAGAAGGAQDAAMSLGAGAQGGGDGRAQGSGVGSGSGEQGGAAGASGGGVSGLEFAGDELPAAVYANGSGNWLSVRV